MTISQIAMITVRPSLMHPGTTYGFRFAKSAVTIWLFACLWMSSWFLSGCGLTVSNACAFYGTDCPVGVISLGSSDVSISESGGNIALQVLRSAGSSGAVTVTYATANGTASSGVDYVGTGGVLNWAAGDSSAKQVAIPILDAKVVGGTRSFRFLLSVPTGGATLGTPTTATITIYDDDSSHTHAAAGILQFTEPSYSVNENAGSLQLAVSRTGGVDGNISIRYRSLNGSAIAGAAFSSTAGSLSWTNGDATPKSITVPILNQGLTSGSQAFSVALSSPPGGAPLGTNSSAMVTIVDNDTVAPVPGTLQWQESAYTVNENEGFLKLGITRAGGSSGSIGVSYATASGTAIAGEAFSATIGTLSWADGDATPKTITVPILNQGLTSGSQAFNVVLSSPSGGATLGENPGAMVTIVDNDAVTPQPGTLQWQPSIYTISENGGSLTMKVTRTGGSSGSISVAYATNGGTAVPGVDYTSETGTLDWADGDSSSKIVTIPIINRQLSAGEFTFDTSLANPTGNAKLGASTALATILDNDTAPSSTDLGCASNFITDPNSGNVTADWTTRLGCSDNYLQAPDAPPLKMTIDSSANLWAVSNTNLPTGLSGSLFNITSGEIDNYGLLTTMQWSVPYACAYLSDSGPLMLPSGNGDIIINNYGILGENYNSTCGPAMIFPTTNYHSPYSITLNNYNAVWAVNGTQGFLGGLPCCGAPGTAATINNYSGGRIGTSTGSALNQGNANNYRNAGMFVTDAWWSWCEHGNGAWFFNNWGYCIGAEEGIYNTSPGQQPQISLYGGPLIPSAHDTNGNLMYGGAISANVNYGKWANASLCVADGELALSASAPILIGNNGALNDRFASVDFYNTVYSYIDPTDGSPKTVDYLPLLYDYPIIGSGAHITLHFDQLYADEAARLQSDVAAGNNSVKTGSFFQYYDGATGVFVTPASWASKGTSNDSGYTYSWCNTAPVVTAFTNTQTIKRPPPGVYYIYPAGPGGSARQYLKDPDNANGNQYYLVNPTTVRLVGNVPQPSGTLYVGPGWTLAVGANLSTTTPLNLPDLVGSPMSSTELISTYGLGSTGTSTANTPGFFTFNPNSTIHLQSAMGSTNDNVDNQPTPVREMLVGSLVIDNFKDENGAYPVALPNLVGGGNLIQSGNSTTILMGADNDLSGSIYIYDGTVAIDAGAGFATPPNFVFGQNDGNDITPTMSHHHPVLDLSQVTTSTFPVNSVQMSGPQMGVQVVGSGTGLIYPTILLGPTILTIVSPSGAAENHLEAVLTGTGGIDLKPDTSLALGYWATQEAGAGEKAYDLSTFSGGTTVETGAMLAINSRGALGYGNLTNAGTVKLAGTRQYLTTWLNDAGPLPEAPPGTLAIGAQLVDAKTPLLNTFNNHTVYVKGNYSQAASGNLTLRVRQGDLAASSLGSGAGVQYETLVADGTANLNGTLTIQFMSGYELPTGGVVLEVVQAGSPIIGTFSQVLTTSDGVTFTPHPLASQEVVNVAQPTGGGSTSVLELTLR